MHGVIAEDDSDAEVLCTLIRRMSHNSTLRIERKGYEGCGELLRNGARQLRLFQTRGCKRFVVCFDADGPSPDKHRKKIVDAIINPSGLKSPCLCLVPVQELEAWILADMHQAIPKMIPSWKPPPVPQPESISSPKEYLEGLSKGSNNKPRYAHATHNPQVVRHLDIATVFQKCRSFRPLFEFVVHHRKIVLPAQTLMPKGRLLRAYVGVGNGSPSSYVSQTFALHDWGDLVSHIRNFTDKPTELTRLCEYGWADLELLDDEVSSLLDNLNGKARIKRTLTSLQKIAANRGEAKYLGLEDGTW